MKKVIFAVTAVITTGLLTGCGAGFSKQFSKYQDTINTISDIAMPIKINDTLDAKKINANGNSATLDFDVKKEIKGSWDNYISSDLQHQLSSTALCSLPALKSGGTTVTLNFYRNGVKKYTTNKAASYLCN